MLPAKKEKPVTFPGTFRAAAIYIIFLLAFTVTGGASTYMSIQAHKVQSLQAVSAMTGIMLVLLLLVLSTSVTVDDTGIVERCLLFWKNVTPWDQVGTVDKIHRGGIGFKNVAGKSLTLLTLLSSPVQEALAEEAIKRGKLRKETDEKVLKKLRAQAIVEQWKK